MEWLRAQLAPLAPLDPLIRELLRLLDPEHAPRLWDSPRGAKRELLRLAARAQALIGVKRKVGDRRNCQRLPRQSSSS
jgi:hypothetical protein